MNIIWAVMIILSAVVGVATGRGEAVSGAVLNSASEAVKACIGMCGAYVFWSGVLGVAQRSGMVERLAGSFKFILKRLFPHSAHDSEVVGAIAMNLGADMLGLGNAATPFGVSAVRKMSRLSGGVANDDIKMFLVINAATVQFFPTTVIAMRTAAGSGAPSDILPGTVICSLFSMLAGIIAAKLFSLMGRKKNG